MQSFWRRVRPPSSAALCCTWRAMQTHFTREMLNPRYAPPDREKEGVWESQGEGERGRSAYLCRELRESEGGAPCCLSACSMFLAVCLQRPAPCSTLAPALSRTCTRSWHST